MSAKRIIDNKWEAISLFFSKYHVRHYYAASKKSAITLHKQFTAFLIIIAFPGLYAKYVMKITKTVFYFD
ncbi:hypothetical protein CKO_03755 [Citrobacter koseri ATCC BAA-895]|uniref:Uncharacterized protein n=1 Tax=Citrobacter koseri (strain ATCC BAA-895 / CDC 4225-83 / SGSC4696) TaxID=290338 RepID=A8AMW8_CITK8|nr:hypothetical protein CKO_03755 [Citrobacter koseri ATCC BAA-895]